MLILLADDHELVRAGIRPFLHELAPVVELIEAESYQQAFSVLEKDRKPDLAVIDLRMPGYEDGALQKFCFALKDVPVVILSGSTSHEDILNAYALGAAGYIPKTYSGPTMVHALRFIISGERFFPAIALDAFLEPVQPVAAAAPPAMIRTAQQEPLLSKLSQRETEILGLMIAGGTNKEIARQLEVQEITVKVHLRNIYRKLGAANRAQAVRIALEDGWRAPVPVS
ncbi:response regulator transcription factor [Insolitispirillum peregrinum]|uniref:response regulator transcription factor n=1 Tax=Insolitispirillum peregrinum TaxID=80876 RepID=UPI00360749DF